MTSLRSDGTYNLSVLYGAVTDTSVLDLALALDRQPLNVQYTTSYSTRG